MIQSVEIGAFSVVPPSEYRHTPLLGENENLIRSERVVREKVKIKRTCLEVS